MTHLVERLAELRLHLDHLARIQPKVTGADALKGDLTLRNDVLHSLQTVSQIVIDIAAELSAKRGERFEDYRAAISNLSGHEEFPAELVRSLEPIPGFRNVVVHEYVDLDYERVVQALNDLEPIERFAEIVRAKLLSQR